MRVPVQKTFVSPQNFFLIGTQHFYLFIIFFFLQITGLGHWGNYGLEIVLGHEDVQCGSSCQGGGEWWAKANPRRCSVHSLTQWNSVWTLWMRTGSTHTFFSPVSPHLKLKFVVMRICAKIIIIIKKNATWANKLSLLQHKRGTAERQASSASGCINRWLLMLSERQFNIVACGLYLAFN